MSDIARDNRKENKVMADKAKDIQQLEALKSDLRAKESLPQEIKKLEEKIKKRKEYIPSLYPSNDQIQPKIPEKSELESAKKKTIDDRVNATPYGKFALAWGFLFWLAVLAVVVSLFVGYTGRTILISVGVLVLGYIISLRIPDPTEKIKAEVELEYQEKFAEIEARKESYKSEKEAYELDRKNRIARAISDDPEIKQYSQELEQCKLALVLCSTNIRTNDVLSERDKNLDTVSYVLDQLITGRADSIKEALQRYDDKRERDSIRKLDRLEREWEREIARKEAQERELQAIMDRAAQREREAKLDRENEALRKDIRKSLDDIEEMKRKLDR